MKTLFCLFPFIFFLTISCSSQDSASNIFQINKLPAEGILLDKGWRFQAGDNPAYALSTYDDSRWKSINPTKNIHDIPQFSKNKIVWLRLRFALDSVLFGRVAVTIQQSGAAEIYLNGKLTHRLGIVSNNPNDVKAFNPLGEPLSFPVEKAAEQVIAVRFALQPGISYSYFLRAQNPGFRITVNTVENAARQQWVNRGLDSGRHVFRVGVFFMLAILYLAFYLFYRTQKINLLFSLYAFLQGINFLLVASHLYINKVAYWFPLHLLTNIIQVVDYVILLYAIYRLLEQKRDWLYYCLAVFAVVCIPINFFTYSWGWLIYGFAFTTLYNLAITWISFKAVKKQKKGAWIIAAGGVAYLIFWLLMTLGFFRIVGPTYDYLFFSLFFDLSFLSIPVAVSIYLGYDFALLNRSLKQKLMEVESLSTEKQQILAVQKEVLEKQVSERTAELKQSLEELKATQAQLVQQEKMASLGELTAGIAHEIQNPLNFVNNFSDVNRELIEELKNELKTNNKEEALALAEDIKENEQKISVHGKRADAIIKGMLQHSRVSTGKKEPTDINALADEYLRLAYYGLKAKDKSFNVNFRTDFDEGIGKVEVVPQDIGRVVLNLYNNAFYAVNEKKKHLNGTFEPTVSVSTKRVGNNVELAVKDNGTGIPHKVLDKIYQPFFTTKPTGEGTGLGLSLSYDIIKAHGGELKVETEEGEFAEFTIQMPII